MFKNLRNQIVLSIVAISSVIILISFTSIFMIMSMTIRAREDIALRSQDMCIEEIIQERNSHVTRLGLTLLSVGVILELLIFAVSSIIAEQLVKPVQEAYEQQREFIANASHELKTPIAAIRANFEALDVEEEPWTDNIDLELDKAQNLVRDLLLLARMDGRVEKAPKKRCDLSEIVKKHVKAIEVRLDGKKLKTDIAEDVVATLVQDDFVQILSILLDNAAKYTKSWVSVELKNNYIKVENDGKEIPAAKMEHIFERFYQVDKTATGVGLGLSIAKSAADHNGWEIIADSNKKSTSFTLYFKR
ncbi:MAG: HAMP domain-containing sensor histidine kinase [bacterium]|nr:HAMP domain-containing sensor histidine kinase [bacterium]